MMDRKKKDELPKMQVGFIDFVCMPLYKILADLLPDLNCMLDGINQNRKNWQTLANDPKGESAISMTTKSNWYYVDVMQFVLKVRVEVASHLSMNFVLTSSSFD